MEKEEFRVYKDTRIFSKDGNLWKGALWEVSNFGNVRKNGKAFLPYEDNDKYLKFAMNCRLHRAVAELFIPNPENKPTIDHINRDKHDNRVCNLRWATQREQAANRDNDAISKSNLGNKHALGNKNVRGRVWVFNPITEQSNLVNPSQLPDYLAKGYIKGQKIKK